ncbi:MAG: PEP-CTERM sorting domain-containing protein [Prosthecobacter sp.]|uniref:PEP-CTERM sorting domain-containing protein n=1 Tax=Prosthecobacter sp. TaxID=1965333 RepID=UPI0038FF2200
MSVATFNLLDWANLTTTTFASRFSAGSYGGYLLGNGDDNLGFDLPDISSSGYGWDISNFITNGTIATVVVPEPSRALLLMFGLAGFVTRRHRDQTRR